MKCPLKIIWFYLLCLGKWRNINEEKETESPLSSIPTVLVSFSLLYWNTCGKPFYKEKKFICAHCFGGTKYRGLIWWQSSCWQSKVSTGHHMPRQKLGTCLCLCGFSPSSYKATSLQSWSSTLMTLSNPNQFSKVLPINTIAQVVSTLFVTHNAY